MDWFAGLMLRPDVGRVDVAARRADAAIEDQRASAPCDGCGRPMQAADRCGTCRSRGLWFCDGCHDRLRGLAARRIAGR